LSHSVTKGLTHRFPYWRSVPFRWIALGSSIHCSF